MSCTRSMSRRHCSSRFFTSEISERMQTPSPDGNRRLTKRDPTIRTEVLRCLKTLAPMRRQSHCETQSSRVVVDFRMSIAMPDAGVEDSSEKIAQPCRRLQ